MELELIPALRSLGIGLIPYSPLHAGLLAGVLQTATEGRISDDSTRPAAWQPLIHQQVAAKARSRAITAAMISTRS